MEWGIETNRKSRLNDYESVIDLGISFAFQPIVDAETGNVTGHEALLRGVCGESAAEIIASIRPENLFYFDQACRMRAIQAAADRGLEGDLHLNCTEVEAANLNEMLDATAESARRFGFAPRRIVLEFGSLDRLGNPRQLAEVRRYANRVGFRVAADNLGLGEAGLKRLAVFRPEIAKFDRELIRNVQGSVRRQAMVYGLLATCRALGVEVIASGVESAQEAEWLKAAGIDTFQGFYFARPSAAGQQDEGGRGFEETTALYGHLSLCAA